MKRRGKKDANHDEIVEAFQRVGCTVAQLHDTGVPGWPDLVVGCIGVNHLVEVKSLDSAYGRAGLNANQSAFARDWRGGKVWICTSTTDAYNLVAEWRKRR